MRTPLVMGNWKMNMTHQEGRQLVTEILEEISALPGIPKAEVVVCPPFTALSDVSQVLSGAAVPVGLGAQNVYWEPSGAYTGEISTGMLQALGCRYVIVGHSERRSLFGETDAGVAKKAKAVLAAGMTPVVCVGESWEQRVSGQAGVVVERQLTAVLDAVGDSQAKHLVVAYEPVWAIGTGAAASPGDAQQMADLIRRTAGDDSLRVMYGGSVQPDNAGEFFAQPGVDGALVGGASLKARSFAQIVAAAGVR